MNALAVLYTLAVGLLTGALARLIMPGHDQLGLLATALLGVAGSFVGGLLSSMIWRRPGGVGFHPAGLVFSVLGAMLLLFVAHHLA